MVLLAVLTYVRNKQSSERVDEWCVCSSRRRVKYILKEIQGTCAACGVAPVSVSHLTHQHNK